MWKYINVLEETSGPEDTGSKLFRKLRNFLRDYMTSHHSRHQPSIQGSVNPRPRILFVSYRDSPDPEGEYYPRKLKD